MPTDSREKSKPSQSKNAYYPKMLEFRQFCNNLYGDEENPRLLTEDKAYVFFSYHAHQTKVDKKKKINHRWNCVNIWQGGLWSCCDIGSFNRDDHNWDHVGDVFGFLYGQPVLMCCKGMCITAEGWRVGWPPTFNQCVLMVVG